jgi:hypothetical protein
MGLIIDRPAGLVLSAQTGYDRDHGSTPYPGYEAEPGTMFPVPAHRDEVPNKEWVIGVVNGATRKHIA